MVLIKGETKNWKVLSCFVTGEKQKESMSSKLWKWLYERLGVYIEDFRFQPEENMVETEEPLSAKRWRKPVVLILFLSLERMSIQQDSLVVIKSFLHLFFGSKTDVFFFSQSPQFWMIKSLGVMKRVIIFAWWKAYPCGYLCALWSFWKQFTL